MNGSGTLGGVDRVLALAETLAGAWSGRARASTTVAQERALLRLLGVSGLDGAGHPLAASVVERAMGTDSRALAHGVVLPFVVAALEYDIAPQRLALDVASGAVDLALETELLSVPARRAAAEAEVGRLAGGALERIDANRIARRELIDVLGDARQPWVGSALAAPGLAAAREEAGARVAAGSSLLRVPVPAVRELSDRLVDLGLEAPAHRAGQPPPDGLPDDPPAGSQRALAVLRSAVDEAAARHGRYVRLATTAPPLGAPEQALVSGFERIDIVEADPIAEIVDGGVDPDRALADHAFSRRLLRRAAALVALGPGPLIVAPDLTRGQPSDSATRSGRAFALAVLGVALARADGLRDEQILLGLVPPWMGGERDAATQVIAGSMLRRLAFPTLAMTIEQPAGLTAESARWPYLVAAAMASAGPVTLVTRPTDVEGAAAVAASTHAAAEVAAEIGAAGLRMQARGPVSEHARAALEAAVETLEWLSGEGWQSILSEPIGGRARARLGADAVVERSDPFDPLAAVRTDALSPPE